MVLFADNRDREHLLELFGETVDRYRIEIHAFALMDTHYHAVARTPDADLSRAMQWLNLGYAAWFNTRHQRKGPVFQRPFASVPVEDAAWAYELSLYVHLNPLRIKALELSKRDRQASSQGMRRPPSAQTVSERLKRLREYPWSSYRAYARESGSYLKIQVSGGVPLQFSCRGVGRHVSHKTTKTVAYSSVVSATQFGPNLAQFHPAVASGKPHDQGRGRVSSAIEECFAAFAFRLFDRFEHLLKRDAPAQCALSTRLTSASFRDTQQLPPEGLAAHGHDIAQLLTRRFLSPLAQHVLYILTVSARTLPFLSRSPA
jgi:REP element-mobilizing transposase RayT